MSAPVELSGQFRADLARMLPEMVHLVAFHPNHHQTSAHASILGHLITGRDELAYASWTTLALVRHHATHGFEVRTIGTDDQGHTRPCHVDDTPPEVRAFSWYIRAGLAGDRDGADAVFAVIPDDQTIDLFPQLVQLAAVITRATGTCTGCGVNP